MGCVSMSCTTCPTQRRVEPESKEDPNGKHEIKDKPQDVIDPEPEWTRPARLGKTKYARSVKSNECIHAAMSYTNSSAALGEPVKESPDNASETKLNATAREYIKPKNSFFLIICIHATARTDLMTPLTREYSRCHNRYRLLHPRHPAMFKSVT